MSIKFIVVQKLKLNGMSSERRDRQCGPREAKREREKVRMTMPDFTRHERSRHTSRSDEQSMGEKRDEQSERKDGHRRHTAHSRIGTNEQLNDIWTKIIID